VRQWQVYFSLNLRRISDKMRTSHEMLFWANKSKVSWHLEIVESLPWQRRWFPGIIHDSRFHREQLLAKVESTGTH